MVRDDSFGARSEWGARAPLPVRGFGLASGLPLERQRCELPYPMAALGNRVGGHEREQHEREQLAIKESLQLRPKKAKIPLEQCSNGILFSGRALMPARIPIVQIRAQYSRFLFKPGAGTG